MCVDPCFTGVKISEIQQDKFFSGIPPLASGALENQKAGWRFEFVGKVQGPKRGIWGTGKLGQCSEMCGKIYENVRLLVRSAHCDWQVDAKSCFSDE